MSVAVASWTNEEIYTSAFVAKKVSLCHNETAGYNASTKQIIRKV